MITGTLKIQKNNKDLSTRDAIKEALGLLVESCVDVTVAALIGFHLPKTRGLMKAGCFIGTVAMAMTAGNKCGKYVMEMFDETVESVEETKQEIKEEMKNAVQAEATVE